MRSTLLRFENSNTLLDLFRPKSSELVTISLKQTTKENYEKVSGVCKKIGLSETITSILQPSNSAEINSQNFIVTFGSDNRILLRRCYKYSGKERFEALYNLLGTLRKEGVRVPEFYSPFEGGAPYYEMEDTDQKVSWIFFKYIEAERCFSGRDSELVDAGEQLGKMHACLKKNYDRKQIMPNQIESHLGPALTSAEWENYFRHIGRIIENGGDEYDKMFMENHQLILEMVQFVEDNAVILQDIDDTQNIHFDLNSSNFLVNKDQQITIMDFDDLKIGNIYTDIGFAFHRLVTTCIEQGQIEESIPEAIKTFLTAYKKNNPDMNLDIEKLVIATYNRALRNIKANLVLKYEQNSKDWLGSIPLNIIRLKQVVFLSNIVKDTCF